MVVRGRPEGMALLRELPMRQVRVEVEEAVVLLSAELAALGVFLPAAAGVGDQAQPEVQEVKVRTAGS